MMNIFAFEVLIAHVPLPFQTVVGLLDVLCTYRAGLQDSKSYKSFNTFCISFSSLMTMGYMQMRETIQGYT